MTLLDDENSRQLLEILGFANIGNEKSDQAVLPELIVLSAWYKKSRPRSFNIKRVMAITLVKNDNGLLPLKIADEKTLILLPYDSEIKSAAYAVETLKAEGILPETAEIQIVAYSSVNKEALEDVKHLVAVSATYGMGELDPWTQDVAYSLLLDKLIDAIHTQGGDVTLVSTQLPYDVLRYAKADAVVIAWYAKGMSVDPRETETAVTSYGPNLPAALRQILDPSSSFTGRLPVDVPQVNEDGQFTGELAYLRGARND